MKTVMSLSLVTLTALTLAAFNSGCSGKYNPPTQKFSIVDGAPDVQGNTVSGSGTLLANSPLAENEQHFSIQVELKNEASSATLYAFGAERLAHSAWLKLTRVGNTIQARLGGPDNAVGIDVTDSLKTLDSSSVFTLNIDMHNEEAEGTHLIVWTEAACPSGSTTCEAKDALFEGHAPGKGRGNFWGLEVRDARVQFAEPASAKAKEAP